MIRISRLADYATSIVSHLAEIGNAQNSAQIATATHLPLPTVRKIMKQLAAKALVQASRGAEGGYQLSLSADRISLGAIVEAIDGPLSLTDCCAPVNTCPQTGSCQSQNTWQTINSVVKNALYNVYLKPASQPMTFQRRHHETN